MAIQLDEIIETSSVTTTKEEDPIYSHIIDRGTDKRRAQDIVFEARVFGHTLTALCGHKFVPERDPQKYPPCQKCLEIFEFAKDFRGVE